MPRSINMNLNDPLGTEDCVCKRLTHSHCSLSSFWTLWNRRMCRRLPETLAGPELVGPATGARSPVIDLDQPVEVAGEDDERNRANTRLSPRNSPQLSHPRQRLLVPLKTALLHSRLPFRVVGSQQRSKTTRRLASTLDQSTRETASLSKRLVEPAPQLAGMEAHLGLAISDSLLFSAFMKRLATLLPFQAHSFCPGQSVAIY